MTKVVISKSMSKIIEYLMKNEYLMFNPETKEHYLFLHEKENNEEIKHDIKDIEILKTLLTKY